jgi:hypothetical protein
VTRTLMSATSTTSANAFVPLLFSPARTSVLQRKCDCGQHTGGGECEECKKEKSDEKTSRDPLLQRSAVGRSAINGVPPIVHEVLRSPGQSLDSGTRGYFEPRFGRDFSQVRVHNSARAAESADAVGALAYAYGQNVVFGRGQYSESSDQGRKVLAHELAHVWQTGAFNENGSPTQVSSPTESSEIEAETIARYVTDGTKVATEGPAPARQPSGTTIAKLSRLVAPATTHCKPGTHGAPADPPKTLTAVEGKAQGLAEAAAILLAIDSAAVSMGIKTGSVNQAYQNRFGLPPKSGKGFLNRLTGKVKQTQDEAMQEELDGLSDRFDRMDSNFGKVLRYRCINGAVSLDKCDTDCVNADASACLGVRTFFLCPTFWALPDNSKATLLIHESFHMLFAAGHGGSGVGRNLRHAECYASFVSDIFNLPTGTPACPSPPQ